MPTLKEIRQRLRDLRARTGNAVVEMGGNEPPEGDPTDGALYHIDQAVSGLTDHIEAGYNSPEDLGSDTTDDTSDTTDPEPDPTDAVLRPEDSELIAEHDFSVLPDDDGWRVHNGDNLRIVDDPEAPESPPTVLEHVYPAGSGDGWNVGGNFNSPSFASEGFSTLWMRMYLWVSPNWNGHRSEINKTFYFRVNDPAAGSGDFIFGGPIGAGDNNLRWGFVRQNSNVDPLQRRLPQNTGPDGADRIERGRWHEIEVYARLNDPGQPNGVLKSSVDGEVVVDYDDVVYLSSEDGPYWRLVNNNQIWGGNSDDTVPEDMSLRIDHMEIRGR